MMAAAVVAAAAAEEASSSPPSPSSPSGEWEAASRALRALAWLGQEFLSDWEAQDLRAALFQLLLLWLVVSLLGIQVAWRVYGNTVTGLYYRQGSGMAASPVTTEGSFLDKSNFRKLMPVLGTKKIYSDLYQDEAKDAKKALEDKMEAHLMGPLTFPCGRAQPMKQ